MENNVYPHILLKKGDIIRIPWNVDTYAKVECLLEWKLICSVGCNVFHLPAGFFFEWDDEIFEPIFDEKE